MKPQVYMMLGLPGSGKTTYSKKLASDLDIIRLSLDEEYAKLGGDLTSHKWNEEIAAHANAAIKSTIETCIRENTSVILDFCPWKQTERAEYRQYIESIGATCTVYYFDLPIEELRQRLIARNQKPRSYDHIITPDMLEAFMVRFDPPINEPHILVSV